ncbi:Hypothetical protein, putative [Bodo saltans]|uniref:Uncharacterized protein n=1 Tax=Bodo saltans TaxID=75058 RepID=A0A0S4J0C3_BODSA|nr:Hypothetical protein, putative [Bodo saltans]|eukprot:CUG39436.1 Hypothetical protein, putative [Bodo saltans]
MFLHESTESIVAQSSHLQPSPHENEEESTPAAASPLVQQEQQHHEFDVNGKTLPPLSGREVEHAAIQQFLTAHLAMDDNTHNTHNSGNTNVGGCGRVLFLCGPCGVGKSTTVARILPPHQSTSSSTEAACTLSSGGGGGVTIDCRIQVPMERLFNPSSPSSAPTSAASAAGAVALTRTVERQIRPIHINCTDLTASSLIDEVVAKMRYRQRKQSEVLAAKETLLRSTSIHKEEKFAESLDKLLVKLNYPYHLSSSSLKFTACDAADAQRFPSATTTRGSTGGRSSTSSTRCKDEVSATEAI